MGVVGSAAGVGGGEVSSVVDRTLNVGFFRKLKGIVLRGKMKSGSLGTMSLLPSSHLVPPVFEQWPMLTASSARGWTFGSWLVVLARDMALSGGTRTMATVPNGIGGLERAPVTVSSGVMGFMGSLRELRVRFRLYAAFCSTCRL